MSRKTKTQVKTTFFANNISVVDCGKIQRPRNGSISGDKTTFQKSVTYSCDKGFELKGPKTIICQSDGQWSSKSTCEGTLNLEII